MSNNYQKFTGEYSDEDFQCGVYDYNTKFFKIKKKSVMKLPMNMFSKGLLILGSYKSYRRKFTNHYAKKLIEKGVKVLYITDALSESQYRANFEIESFKKHIGLNKMDNNLFHMEELSGKFNKNMFDDGVMLSIVHSKTICKYRNIEIQKDYNEKLISLLTKINEADINSKFVIIIDEDAPDRELDKNLFKENITKLNNKGFGLVICGQFGKRYRDISNNINNYVLFTSRDPSEDLMGVDMFGINAFDYDTKTMDKNFLNYIDKKDIQNLSPKEFYYTQKDYCGWSKKVTFDADGCECCMLPMEDYWTSEGK